MASGERHGIYSDYHSILKKHWPEIREKVDVLDILPHISTKISTTERQRIEQENQNHGKQRGADALLDCLLRRTKECFPRFIMILEYHHYDTLVFSLKKDLSNNDFKLIEEERNKNEFEKLPLMPMRSEHLDQKPQ